MPIPDPVAYVADLMSTFQGQWALCGGWAIDAWRGCQTREHHDVDMVVFHDDLDLVFKHFADWALVAHDLDVRGDTNEPWDGRNLSLPAHIHVPRRGTVLSTSKMAIHTAYELELVIGERGNGNWILNQEPRITLPLSGAIRWSAWGLPTAVPELVLFYKAGGGLLMEDWETMREHDEQDFHDLLPILTPEQREWLGVALTKTCGDHPWLEQLRPV